MGSQYIEASREQEALAHYYAGETGGCEVWMSRTRGQGDIMHIRTEDGLASYDTCGHEVWGSGHATLEMAVA